MKRTFRVASTALAITLLGAFAVLSPTPGLAQESKSGETTLKAKAAWESPQGKALAEFLRAARGSDKTALKRVMATHQAETLDGPNAAKFLDFIKTSLDPKLATFDSLVINAKGTSALATISGRYDKGEVTKRYTINKADDGWRVTM
jgi:hypothetical protein